MDSENGEPRYNKKTGIPILRYKEDWGDVSRRILVSLDEIGVIGLKDGKFTLPVDPKEHVAWYKLNHTARVFLIGQVSGVILDQIDYELSAQEIWNALRALFHGKSAVNKSILLEEFWEAKCNKAADVDPFLARLATVTNKLNGLGMKLEDEQVALKMIHAIPKDMDSVRQAIFSHMQSTDATPSSEQVAERMRGDAKRILHTEQKDLQEVIALGAKAYEPGRVQVKTCSHCRRQGHSVEVCYKLNPCPVCGRLGHGQPFHSQMEKLEKMKQAAMKAEVVTSANKDNTSSWGALDFYMLVSYASRWLLTHYALIKYLGLDIHTTFIQCGDGVLGGNLPRSRYLESDVNRPELYPTTPSIYWLVAFSLGLNFAYSHYKHGTESQPKKFETTVVAFMAAELSEIPAKPNGPYWIYDTGATVHITGDKKSFITFKTLARDEQVVIKTAGGTFVNAVGRGDIVLHISTGPHYHTIRLHDVLYVPGAAQSLLSGPKVDESGHSVTVANGAAIITSRRTNNIVGTATLAGGVYVLDCKYAQKPQTPRDICVFGVTTADLWHQRLGHAGGQAVKALTSSGAIKTSGSLDLCHSCVEGKSARKSVPKVATRATRVLDEVHMDTYTMGKPTMTGKRYLVMYTDAFSGFSMGYLQSTKSAAETLENFKSFKVDMENVSGQTIKILHGDNGTEFINADFEHFCKVHGISRTDSTPYVHEQNGIAERKNRTIAGMGLSMMHAAKLPWSFWGAAFMAAIYTSNRCPVARHNWKSPAEIIQGRPPRLDHLRVFGCIARVHVPSENRRKTDPKTIIGRFVGYDNRKHCYNILVDKRIIHTLDVTFFENEFDLSKWTGTSDDMDWEYNEQVVDSVITERRTQSPDEDEQPLLVPRSPSPPSTDSLPSTVPSSPDTTNSPDSLPSTVPSSPAAGTPSADGPVLMPPPAPRAVRHRDLQPITAPRRPHLHAVEQGETESEQGVPEVVPHRVLRNRQRQNYESPPDDLSDVLHAEVAPDDDVFENTCALAMAMEAVPQQFKDMIQNVSMTLSADIPVTLPKTYTQATSGPFANEWKMSIEREMTSIRTNQTYDLVLLPEGRKAIQVKWVFVHKFDGQGRLARRKSRLVAKGYRQIEGVDYWETFAPTPKFSSIRMIQAVGVQHGWYHRLADVDVAFLNADLDEEIYLEQPEGFVVEGKEDYVWKLKKCLYGLKQSPRAWNTTLDTHLRSQGFIPSKADPCIYVKRFGDNIVVISAYVDDLIFSGNNLSTIEAVISNMKRRFSMKDLGMLEWYLGIKFTASNDRRTMSLTQTQYVDDLVKKFRLEEAAELNVPMSAYAAYLSSQHSPQTAQERQRMTMVPYRELVGSLQYLAVATRPDIAAAVSVLSRFLSNPGESHWRAAKDVLRYVKGTRTMGLQYDSSNGLETFAQIRYDGPTKAAALRYKTRDLTAFSDSDFATCTDDRRSVGGFVTMMSGAAVSWKSQKQATVALSTLEAEYMSMSRCAQETIHLRFLLSDLGYEENKPTTLYGDNQGCLAVAKNPKHHDRVKHVDYRHHFLRERVLSGELDVLYCSTKLMIADALTKPLDTPNFTRMREGMGLKEIGV
jgi:transposase InsO family protein